MQSQNLTKTRLIVMNFLEFAAWGAYLTSMARYLVNLELGARIAWFYSIQGVVSIFMPAIMGIVADRWIPAQKVLGLCHLLAGVFMIGTAFYSTVPGFDFTYLFLLYTLSVAFYMPTLAISNSVAFTVLVNNGMDTIKAFPPIRVWGTIGFIVTMWMVDLLGFQTNQYQFVTSAIISFLLFAYTFTLPNCPVYHGAKKKSMVEAFGLKAFALFKQRKMAVFFVFSMLLGVSLQITNAFANIFISSFATQKIYADTFGVLHSNILISLSQISETCCILLIPFFMKRYGIKRVMMIAMLGWVLRFGLFGLGNPGDGVWMFVLSMIVYGVAFDFFNISGALFVDKTTSSELRSSAQGLFMLMTNGIGASVGTIGAQFVVNAFTHEQEFNGQFYTVGNWSACWFVFAGYSLLVLILFTLLFKNKKQETQIAG